VAVIQLFWVSRHQAKIEVDKLDPEVPWWGGLIAVGLTYGLFLLFEKLSVKNRMQVALEEEDLVKHAQDLYLFNVDKNS
jgi:hypothetical protein